MRALTVLALLCLLAGCGAARSALQLVGLGAPPNLLQQVEIEAEADCNQDLPVALDLVFVQDAALADLLKGLGGPEWFARKRELLHRHGAALQLLEYEVVPLSVKRIDALPDGHKDAPSVLLFANYVAAEGQYVAELAGYGRLRIVLQRETYLLQDLDAEGN